MLCWSSLEEIPHVQGQRNPSKTVGVARGHQRADRLKPQSQKTSQSDYRTTVVYNSNLGNFSLIKHTRGFLAIVTKIRMPDRNICILSLSEGLVKLGYQM